MIGRMIIAQKEANLVAKRRVDAIHVCPYYDYELYFDANNTWVDLQAITAALNGLTEWQLRFTFSTTDVDGDIMKIIGSGEHIGIGVLGGYWFLWNTQGANTLVVTSDNEINDGAEHEILIQVDATGNSMYLDGEHLLRSYGKGDSDTVLPLPATITELSLGKIGVGGYFGGVIKDVSFEQLDGTKLVHLKLNDNAETAQDLISGNFCPVHAGYWEQGFNGDPIWRKVDRAYVCKTAGQWELAHIG